MQSSLQSSSLYQPIFTFSQAQFRQNKLIDKSVPAVQVETSSSTVKCKDADAQVALYRQYDPSTLYPRTISQHFFSTGHMNQCGVNVGLISKDGNPRAYAGKYINSIGYVNGQIHLNKKKIGAGFYFSKKDRIGCGINCLNQSFFFTKNKQIIARDIKLPKGNKWNQFYPAVALQHKQETVKCHFEKRDFIFEVQKLSRQIQQQGIGLFNLKQNSKFSSNKLTTKALVHHRFTR